MKEDPKAVADYSVKAADALMEKLYPLANEPEEKAEE